MDLSTAQIGSEWETEDGECATLFTKGSGGCGVKSPSRGDLGWLLYFNGFGINGPDVIGPWTGKPTVERQRESIPLTGRWRHGGGYICCGTLRIAKADFDTNPAPEVKAEILDWIVAKLNAAGNADGL